MPDPIDPMSDPADPTKLTDGAAPSQPEAPAAEAPAPVTPLVEETPRQSLSPTKNSKKRMMLFGGLVVVVIAAGAAALVLNRNNQNNKTATNTVQKKDIPLFRVEYLDGEVPQYPVSEGGYGGDISIASQMFEGLVQYQGQTKIAPLLASGWTNPTQTSWLFNLRKNVKFNTGRAMTADDVKYTFDYIIAHQSDPNGVYTNVSTLDTVKSVDVVSPYQVKITTTEPDPLFLGKISFIGIVDSKATAGSYDAGTGPYVVKTGTTPSDSDIDLVAADNYWGGHVYTKELKFHIVTDLAQIKADLGSDNFDLIGILTDTAAKYLKVPYTKFNVPELGSDVLILNTNRSGSPLQSLAARQAIDYAMDRNAFISKAGIEGVPANQIVPVALAGHDPSIKDTPFDLSKAKQLLATVKNANQQITIGSIVNDLQAQTLVAQLTAAGFNVKDVVESDPDTFATNANNGDYDIYLTSTSSGEVDGLDMLSGDLTGSSNYDNPQIDTLLTQVSNTFDSAKRIQLMQQVDKLADADKPVIPLDYSDNTFFLTKKNAVLTVDQPAFDASVYFWKVYQK